MKTAIYRRKLVQLIVLLQPLYLTSCGIKTVTVQGEQVTPAAPYCSTVTTYTGSTINVSGTAYYAPRVNGNGEVADGGFRYGLTVTNPVVGTVYTITLAGVPFTYTAIAGDTAITVTQKLVDLINATSAVVNASQIRIRSGTYDYYVLVNAKSPGIAFAHTSSVTVTETARTAANPIRYAEIMVKNSSGSIIQCGQTSGTGTYTVSLPQAGSGTYTVYVNSRIVDATKARAYVLDYHVTNNHYSVSKSVSASATSANNNMLAPGDGTLEGGAFNILDQIIKTNEFLKTYVSAAHGCGTTIPACVPFSPGPIVNVFWKKGVNPYTYFGSSSPSSFYVGDSKLYILGGSNGDVDNSDTDHFDNSVIVHEYGHFLEEAFAKSSSPGGYHDGNTTVDPRLAWSEGWSDFLQSAVSGNVFYRDTKGNSSGTLASTVLINENLDTTNWDTPTGGSEGMFHEFSITRLLWDAIDPHPVTGAGTNEAGDDVATDVTMSEIWTAFAGAMGLKNPATPFTHVGIIHKVQDALVGRTSWNTLRNSEKQNGSANYASVGLREYATPLVVGGTCNLTLDPVFVATDAGDFATSDQYRNNDFIAYYHSGGPLSVVLTYSTVAYNDPPDLDLYVYNSDYTYGSTATMLGRSETNRATGCVANNANCTNLTETVSSSAPAGYYLINVKAYTGDGAIGGAATYHLTINGAASCPTP